MNRLRQYLISVNPARYSMLICLLYWAYLFFNTSMDVKFDSAWYVTYAETIYREGFNAFIKMNSVNVGLYPSVIALSMKIADWFLMSYQTILKLIQFGFFFSAQMILLRILQLMKINRYVTAAAILYFGISPALVNSVLSIFSEVITYPLVLGIVYFSVKMWKGFLHRQLLSIFGNGFLIASLFAITSTARVVYEPLLLLYMFLSFILFLYVVLIGKRGNFTHLILAGLMIFLTFNTVLHPYKKLNEKYNGFYGLVKKAGFIFYGSAAGRTQHLSPKRLMSFLALVPGDKVCIKYFGKEEYNYWWNDVYRLGVEKEKELVEGGIPMNRLEPVLFQLAFERILNKPFQYALLCAAEAHKLVFWESTQIGFVNYPAWLIAVYHQNLIKNFLRLFIFIVTYISLFYVLIQTWKHKKLLFDDQSVKWSICFFCLVIIISNLILHSVLISVIRYSFPFVSLYFICIAVTVDSIFLQNNQKADN